MDRIDISCYIRNNISNNYYDWTRVYNLHLNQETMEELTFYIILPCPACDATGIDGGHIIYELSQ